MKKSREKNKNDFEINFYDFSIFKLEDRFTLDFDRVPLGQKSRLELAITNLTNIESGIKAKVAKFKTRVRLVLIKKCIFKKNVSL